MSDGCEHIEALKRWLSEREIAVQADGVGYVEITCYRCDVDVAADLWSDLYDRHNVEAR